MDHKVTIRESKKIKQIHESCQRTKKKKKKRKNWNNKVMVIPIVVGALGTVPKIFEKRQKELENRDRIETIQTPERLGFARILGRVLVTGGDLCSLRLQWKSTSKNWFEKPVRSEIPPLQLPFHHPPRPPRITTMTTYNNKSKKSCLPLVEGDQKAPFSTATTLRCRGGRYSFPRIAPLYPWYVPYIAEW